MSNNENMKQAALIKHFNDSVIEAAKKKIEAADRMYGRVKDAEAEVKRLSDELSAMKRPENADEMAALKSALNDAEADAKNTADKLSAAEAELLSMENKMNEAKNANAYKALAIEMGTYSPEEMSMLDKAAKKARKSADEAADKLSAAKTSVSATRSALSSAEVQLASAKIELEELPNKIAAIAKRRDKQSNANRQEWKRRIELLPELIQTLSDERDAAEKAYNAAEKTLADTEAAAKKASAEAASYNLKVKNAVTRFAKMAAEKYSEKHAKLTERVGVLEKESAKKKKAVKKAESAVNKCKTGGNLDSTEYNRKLGELKKAESKLNTLKVRAAVAKERTLSANILDVESLRLSANKASAEYTDALGMYDKLVADYKIALKRVKECKDDDERGDLIDAANKAKVEAKAAYDNAEDLRLIYEIAEGEYAKAGGDMEYAGIGDEIYITITIRTAETEKACNSVIAAKENVKAAKKLVEDGDDGADEVLKNARRELKSAEAIYEEACGKAPHITIEYGVLHFGRRPALTLVDAYKFAEDYCEVSEIVSEQFSAAFNVKANAARKERLQTLYKGAKSACDKQANIVEPMEKEVAALNRKISAAKKKKEELENAAAEISAKIAAKIPGWEDFVSLAAKNDDDIQKLCAKIKEYGAAKKPLDSALKAEKEKLKIALSAAENAANELAEWDSANIIAAARQVAARTAKNAVDREGSAKQYAAYYASIRGDWFSDDIFDMVSSAQSSIIEAVYCSADNEIAVVGDEKRHALLVEAETVAADEYRKGENKAAAAELIKLAAYKGVNTFLTDSRSIRLGRCGVDISLGEIENAENAVGIADSVTEKNALALLAAANTRKEFADSEEQLREARRRILNRIFEAAFDAMTDRQRRVFKLIAAGYSFTEVAKKLKVGEYTIRKDYMGLIRSKVSAAMTSIAPDSEVARTIKAALCADDITAEEASAKLEAAKKAAEEKRERTAYISLNDIVSIPGVYEKIVGALENAYLMLSDARKDALAAFMEAGGIRDAAKKIGKDKMAVSRHVEKTRRLFSDIASDVYPPLKSEFSKCGASVFLTAINM